MTKHICPITLKDTKVLSTLQIAKSKSGTFRTILCFDFISGFTLTIKGILMHKSSG